MTVPANQTTTFTTTGLVSATVPSFLQSRVFSKKGENIVARIEVSQKPAMHTAAAASLSWGAEGTGRHRRSHSRGVIVDILGEEAPDNGVGSSVGGLHKSASASLLGGPQGGETKIGEMQRELEKKMRMVEERERELILRETQLPKVSAEGAGRHRRTHSRGLLEDIEDNPDNIASHKKDDASESSGGVKGITVIKQQLGARERNGDHIPRSYFFVFFALFTVCATGTLLLLMTLFREKVTFGEWVSYYFEG